MSTGRTLGEIIREALPTSPVQLLHECVLGARSVGRRNGNPPHTRVEFATTNMTPDDLLYYSAELGRPESRKPLRVGIIVWVPTDVYERPESEVRDSIQTRALQRIENIERTTYGDRGLRLQMESVALVIRELVDELEMVTKARDACQQENSRLALAKQAAERTVASLAKMLGWENVPPQDTLEADIRALKARAKRASDLQDRVAELVSRLAMAGPLCIGSIDSHRDARYSTVELKELIEFLSDHRNSEAA